MWQTIQTVKSSSVAGRKYAVQRSRKSGKLRCIARDTKKTCLGFKYSGVKWCRHLETVFPVKGGR